MSEDGPLKNGEMGDGVQFDLLWKKTEVADKGAPEQKQGTFGNEFRFKGGLSLPDLPFGNKDE